MAVTFPSRCSDTMITTEPNMTNLFLQLGLDAGEADIAAFILQHQLPAEVRVTTASFWSEGQRHFLAESLKSDNDWAIVVDELNEALHSDATVQANPA
jgi:hypothetical protein